MGVLGPAIFEVWAGRRAITASPTAFEVLGWWLRESGGAEFLSLHHDLCISLGTSNTIPYCYHLNITLPVRVSPGEVELTEARPVAPTCLMCDSHRVTCSKMLSYQVPPPLSHGVLGVPLLMSGDTHVSVGYYASGGTEGKEDCLFYISYCMISLRRRHCSEYAYSCRRETCHWYSGLLYICLNA